MREWWFERRKPALAVVMQLDIDGSYESSRLFPFLICCSFQPLQLSLSLPSVSV